MKPQLCVVVVLLAALLCGCAHRYGWDMKAWPSKAKAKPAPPSAGSVGTSASPVAGVATSPMPRAAATVLAAVTNAPSAPPVAVHPGPASVVASGVPPAPATVHLETPPAKSGQPGTGGGVPSSTTAAPSSMPATGDTQRVHIRFASREKADQFLQLLTRKEIAVEDLRVCSRLLEEKNTELQGLNKALADSFFMKPDANYQYDAQAMVIYELIPVSAGGSPSNAPQTAASAGTSFTRTVHLRLNDKAAEQRFLQLAAAKRLAFDEIQTLRLLVREKQMETERFDQALKDGYAISKDRRYHYDRDAMVLYEIIPLPSMEGVAPGNDAGGGIVN